MLGNRNLCLGGLVVPTSQNEHNYVELEHNSVKLEQNDAKLEHNSTELEQNELELEHNLHATRFSSGYW